MTRLSDVEIWIEAGRMHHRRGENNLWEIAWWLVEGQMKAFDSGFTESAKILGLAPSTIENYYRVGLAYPRGRNHPDLAFTTHRELLRERDETSRALVLSMAIEHGWYADDVVRYFEANPPTARPLVGVDTPPSRANRTPYQRKYFVGAHVKCPCGCEHVFPIKGNKVPRPTQQDSDQAPS